MQSLTAAQRFELPSGSELSLWCSQVTHISADHDSIAIAAMNDYKTRRFDFNYHGVRKVHARGIDLSFLPAIVVQELVLLRSGLFRHTISDMGGHLVTIYASSIAFQDNRIQ
ncbi:MAG: hypothetical protein R3F22_00040 [Lysobacteraceae bacterium]